MSYISTLNEMYYKDYEPDNLYPFDCKYKPNAKRTMYSGVNVSCDNQWYNNQDFYPYIIDNETYCGSCNKNFIF